MKKIIIGIHGLSNKPAANVLKEWWIESIKEGLKQSGFADTDVPFEMVFWADILYGKPLDPSVKDIEDPLFLDEPYLPINGIHPREESTIKTKIMQYVEDQLDAVFLNEDMSLNFEDVTDKIVHHYFIDLEKYYSNDLFDKINKDRLLRDIIREKLRKVLRQYQGWDILLIAHSMGSIIAYDVLLELEEEIKIDTFITIGSPLGLPIIVSRIYAEMKKQSGKECKVRVPNSIQKSWYNFSDISDTVALDHTLHDDFSVSDNGIEVQDNYIYNDYEIEGKRNPHKSFGYLRSKEVAKIISSFLEPVGLKHLMKNYSKYLHRIKDRIWGLFDSKDD